MPATTIVRPVWRRFSAADDVRAANHVAGGGHAALVDDGRDRIDLLLTVGTDKRITEQGQWALLSIEQERWRRVRTGPAAGLATARVRPEYEEAVLDWCDRDQQYRARTRKIELDCLTCGACCHESNVVLYEEDLDRWDEAKRHDLYGRKYVQRGKDGHLRLRFLSNGKCQHLKRDLKCRIYSVRPHNCRVFPMGSEACLAARESTRGWRDG